MKKKTLSINQLKIRKSLRTEIYEFLKGEIETENKNKKSD